MAEKLGLLLWMELAVGVSVQLLNCVHGKQMGKARISDHFVLYSSPGHQPGPCSETPKPMEVQQLLSSAGSGNRGGSGRTWLGRVEDQTPHGAPVLHCSAFPSCYLSSQKHSAACRGLDILFCNKKYELLGGKISAIHKT